MPHTWIGAEFATAIRRMLLRENGSTLELFRAVPEAWWNGEGITLHELADGLSARQSEGSARPIPGDRRSGVDGPARRTESPSDIPEASELVRTGGHARSSGDVISAPNLKRLVIDF